MRQLEAAMKWFELFDLAPGWLYAVLLALALVALGTIYAQRGAARQTAAEAQRDLAALRASSAEAVASLVQASRVKEGDLNKRINGALDELRHTETERDAVRASLAQRLHVIARPAGELCAGVPQAVASASGDGSGSVPGLQLGVGEDLIGLDGQAQDELASLAEAEQRLRDLLRAYQQITRAEREVFDKN